MSTVTVISTPGAGAPTGTDHDFTPADAPLAHDLAGDVSQLVSATPEAAPVVDWPEGFDPTRHALDANGAPKLRADGTFALKRGRKAGGATQQAPSVAPVQSTATAVDATASTMSTDELARQVCNLGIGIAVATIGPEWAPADKSESTALKNAFKNYFDAKGVVQMSPEWGLVFAIAAYSAPRLMHENTQSKFSKAIDWCKVKVFNLKNRLFK